MAKRSNKPGVFSGLSTKLIAMIILVILAVEVVIFLPSMANARVNWLRDRLHTGAVALQVMESVPEDMVLSEDLTDRLLTTAGVSAIAFRHEGQRLLIERLNEPMPMAAVTADLRLRDPYTLISGGLGTIFYGADRTLRILGETSEENGDLIEVLLPETPLRDALLIYSRNIFFLSLFVALITAMVVYVFINRAFIKPIQKITANIIAFRQAPENATLIISPSQRKDEIGVTERELAAMESDLFAMLRQQRHLADLGLAVAKINHDLRNTLTSAQLLSDQVATLDDPEVQRLAPRLVHTLDKAIGFAQSVLDYGRETTEVPRPQPVDLRALIEEALFDAGLVAHPDITVSNNVPDEISIRVDPDQMARVFVNLTKNAREALELNPPKNQAAKTPTIAFDYEVMSNWLRVSVSDNGPGLAPRARDNLFVAFQGSARAGGTGLGLAISREIAEAHGGELNYCEAETGANFELLLPLSARIA